MTVTVTTLFALLIAVALFIGAVVLFVRGGSATRWTIGIIGLVLFVFVVPALFGLRAVRQEASLGQVAVTPAWGVLLLFILFSVTLATLIGLIVLFVRGSSTTRWVIGSVAALLFLLIGPALLYFSMARPQHAIVVAEQQRDELLRRQALIAAAEAANQANAPEVGRGDSTWRHAADHYLRADHYPSAKAAARGLAAEIEPLLDTVAPAGATVTEVVVMSADSVDASVVQAFTEVLYERNPKLTVKTGSGDALGRSSAIVVALGATAGSYYAIDERGRKNEGVVLDAKLRGPGGSFSRSAPILNKPWVDDFNGFISSRHNDTYMLAQSTQPALHSGEAQTLAIEDAAQQLMAHAQGRFLGHRHGSINSSRLYQQILKALHEGRFIEDRFVQAFQRPGGNVYQAWLLIRPDPILLEQMAMEQFTAADYQRTRYFSTAGGAVVMLIVVLVLYGFLNAVTKGYYATGLKVAAAAAVVCGVVGLLLLA